MESVPPAFETPHHCLLEIHPTITLQIHSTATILSTVVSHDVNYHNLPISPWNYSLRLYTTQDMVGSFWHNHSKHLRPSNNHPSFWVMARVRVQLHQQALPPWAAALATSSPRPNWPINGPSWPEARAALKELIAWKQQQ